MNKDFDKIAKRIKRRRLLASGVLVLAAFLASISIVNYKASQGADAPVIALGGHVEKSGATSIRVTNSLGFKHVEYKSKYGKNYSECIPFWKSYDKEPVSITPDQYDKIKAHIISDADFDTVNKNADKYFCQFKTYEADVIDTAENGDELKVFMLGNFYYFIEYEDDAYEIPLLGNQGASINSKFDTPQVQVPAVVTVNTEENNFDIIDVKFYENGDAGSDAIWKDFSKGAAMKALLPEEDDVEPNALRRARLDAAAYLGASFDFDKRLEFDIDQQQVSVYQIKDATDISENEDENDILLKTEILKPRS